MPVSIPQYHAPNCNTIVFAPGDNSAWHQVTNFPLGPNAMPAARHYDARIRSVASDGVTDGSAFQFLVNQATTPSAGTAGKLVSGNGQTETIPGGAYNLWVKASVGTDKVICEVFY